MIYRDEYFDDAQFMVPGQSFENCSFENCHVNLDDISMRKCRLRNCVMHYSGRKVTIDGLDAANCVFAPEADLLRGLQTMGAMFGVDEFARLMRELLTSDRGRLN